MQKLYYDDMEENKEQVGEMMEYDERIGECGTTAEIECWRMIGKWVGEMKKGRKEERVGGMKLMRDGSALYDGKSAKWWLSWGGELGGKRYRLSLGLLGVGNSFV